MRANRESRPDYYVEIPEVVRKAYGISDPEPDLQEESTESTDVSWWSASGLAAVVICCVLVFGVMAVLGMVGQVTLDLSAISLMNANHGMTMKEFCEGTRYETYEYWAAFDENGRKVGECTVHDVGCVEIPFELYRYAERRGAVTDVHCHPGFDCPFSIPDLVSFPRRHVSYGIERICVVSPNYFYQLEITENTSLNGAEYANFISSFYNANKDNPTYFTYQVLADGTTGYASNDAFVEVLAERYGFTFTKTPLD